MASRKSVRGDSPNRVRGVSSDYERDLGIKMEKPRRTLGARIASIMLWVFVLALAVIVVFATVFLPRIAEQNQTLIQQTEDTYNPGFKSRFDGLGQTVIKQWYDLTPASSVPVALAEGVEWPSGQYDTEVEAPLIVKNVSFLSGETTRKDEESYEERLTYVATVNGFNQGVEITFVIPNIHDADATPVLASAPSFVSIPMADPSIVNLKPNSSDVSSTDSIRTQMESWAMAWTENDSAGIKQATGDNSSEHYYLGLYPGTWTYVEDSMNINWATYIGTGENEAHVQATWQIKSPDQYIETQDDNGNDITITKTGMTTTQVMEFLVTDPNSGLPRVVDWGPVGSASAESLEEYGSAVDSDIFERTMSMIGQPTEEEEPEGTSQTPAPDETETSEPEESETEADQSETKSDQKSESETKNSEGEGE